MKVKIDISEEYKEPFAVIHTDKVTDEIQRIIDLFVKPLLRKFSRIMYPDDVETVETENVIKDVDDEYASKKGGQHEQQYKPP